MFYSSKSILRFITTRQRIRESVRRQLHENALVTTQHHQQCNLVIPAGQSVKVAARYSHISVHCPSHRHDSQHFKKARPRPWTPAFHTNEEPTLSQCIYLLLSLLVFRFGWIQSFVLFYFVHFSMTIPDFLGKYSASGTSGTNHPPLDRP